MVTIVRYTDNGREVLDAHIADPLTAHAVLRQCYRPSDKPIIVDRCGCFAIVNDDNAYRPHVIARYQVEG